MSIVPSLDDWNRQSVNVMQAMLGMISPNFRMVTLDHDGTQWIIGFVLESVNAEDREELADFEAEWDALQSGPTPRDLQVSFTAGSLAWPSAPTRALYRRREVMLIQE
ncbi:hypothetical protein HMP09_2845 [Sphingomonas sp. HMP9]|uniref:hypothetical protein n=1 Tax=Sphingomonas sp. HMP9 TaxID=1517554 RepID=UPI0015968598|nr:hypothetical protein [Sphingomonas sp. HMP9]BCA63611.1 hypothetical protein HMP09_2845 [Sphingomonas sp. HMP9]